MRERPEAGQIRAREIEAEVGGDLLEGCLRALGERVPTARWRATPPGPAGEPPLDARLDLVLDDHRARFAALLRPRIGKEQIGPLAHLVRTLEERGEHLLVCAPRIPDELGRRLRGYRVAYLDLGGNAHLQAPGLYLLIEGQPVAKTERGRRDLTGTELRLLGVFLRDRDAGEAIQKELAERAGMALGAVGRGREKLVALRILTPTGGRQWRVTDRAEGLRRFADGWAAVVRHKLRPRRYRMLSLAGRGELEERLAELTPELDCLLGGERAAGHLTRLLLTDHATLHVPPGKRRATAEALFLVPDERGPITLLERYGRGDAFRWPELPGIALAHPLLIWAECLTVPDERVGQAAKRIHEDLLQESDRG